MRVVGLTECGTHAIVDAEVVGVAAGGELQHVGPLARSLERGMLVLCDRGSLGADLWRALNRTGAQLLWCPRVVNLKMSNFKLKRPAHRSWAQPTTPTDRTVVILPTNTPRNP